MVSCPECGRENPDQARFCSACGSPLPAFGAGSRRTVTLLFCDVAQYTAIGERLDSELLHQLKWRFYSVVSPAIEAHGGTEEKYIGDAVFAVFGIPNLHEDDALRAARAALEIRERMAEFNAELRRDWGFEFQLRTGINTGEVTVGGWRAAGGGVTGDAVNVASRLETAAAPDEILVSEATLRMIRSQARTEPVGPLTLDGKQAPMRAYRLLGLREPKVGPGARGATEGFVAPMIGRDRELRRLQDALDQVVEEQTCHLFTVLGPAGIGKSRMVGEFRESIGERATVLSGRCLSYGEGITYWPLMEMVRQAVGISPDEGATPARARLRAFLEGVQGAEAVVDGIAPLIGLDGTEVGAEESFWAVRTLIGELARRRPLVLCFDDVHWAEPTLLDLISYIADWSRDVPVLLLCLARPELLEGRKTWGGGLLSATSMQLQPLSAARCQSLIQSLMGSDDLDEALVDRITTSAAGNPLFVEQMLAALVDDSRLRRAGDRWIATGDLTDVQVPPTISALLAARLDRLEVAERKVLERAAVVGQRFYLDAVEDLSEASDAAMVAAHCQALVRKELIQPDRSDLPGLSAYRFLHVLLRDCAYQATPKRQRADLHQRFADWLRVKLVSGPGEQDELVGYHLEQAYLYRAELGVRDADNAELGRQAAGRLIEAADRVRQSDEPGAAALLKRAIKLLPVTDPLRIRAEIDLGWALFSFGRLTDAERLLRQATDRAVRAGEDVLRASARLAHLRVMFATNPEGLVAETLAEVKAALPVFEAAGDSSGAALACRTQAVAYVAGGRYTLAEQAMTEAVRHAEASGVARDTLIMRRDLVHLTSWVPRHVEDSLDVAHKLLAAAGDDRGPRRFVLSQLAVLHAMAGHPTEAMENLAAATEIVWDVRGPRGDPFFGGFVVARVALLTGDLDKAVKELRRSCRHLSRIGERAYLATRAAALADVLFTLGNYTDAGTYVGRCREAAAHDQWPAQSGWCAVHAKLKAVQGKNVEAVNFAEAACDLAERTDDWDAQASAWLAYAEVLYRTGDLAGVEDKIATAVERYERKGNVAGVAQARSLVDRLRRA